MLSNLLERPDAYRLMEKLRMALEQEQALRQHFYETVEENQKMEFINGEIVFHSPVKKRHNSATLHLAKLFDAYAVSHDLGYVGVEKIMISLTRNDYEPDICFFREDVAATFAEDQVQFPAPDFVVEVLSPSTEKHDRETKLVDYAAHGIREYWIVDPMRQTVEQYVLEGELYELLFKATEGILHCRVMTGLSFPVTAVFDRKVNAQIARTL